MIRPLLLVTGVFHRIRRGIGGVSCAPGSPRNRTASGRVPAATMVALALGALASPLGAQTATPPDDTRHRVQLRVMTEAARALQFRWSGATERATPSVHDQPILRYGDLARGVPDATVWRVGSEGRPDALVVLEIRKKLDQHILNYEFLALSGEPFELSASPFTWTPATGMLQWKPLGDAPQVSENELIRLSQMKLLSRRFSASELYQGERSNLRMLSQPIHRYRPSADSNADGTIFTFVYGTNPEVVLFVETDGRTWSYAVGRLSGAALWLMLDGEVVWQQEAATAPAVHEPYTSHRHAVSLPPTQPTP